MGNFTVRRFRKVDSEGKIMVTQEDLSKAMQNGMKLTRKLDDTARQAGVKKLTNDLKGIAAATNDAKLDKLNDWTGDYLMLCVKTNVSPFSKITTTVNVEDKIKLANAITSRLTGTPTTNISKH